MRSIFVRAEGMFAQGPKSSTRTYWQFDRQQNKIENKWVLHDLSMSCLIKEITMQQTNGWNYCIVVMQRMTSHTTALFADQKLSIFDKLKKSLEKAIHCINTLQNVMFQQNEVFIICCNFRKFCNSIYMILSGWLNKSIRNCDCTYVSHGNAQLCSIYLITFDNALMNRIALTC